MVFFWLVLTNTSDLPILRRKHWRKLAHTELKYASCNSCLLRVYWECISGGRRITLEREESKEKKMRFDKFRKIPRANATDDDNTNFEETRQTTTPKSSQPPPTQSPSPNPISPTLPRANSSPVHTPSLAQLTPRPGPIRASAPRKSSPSPGSQSPSPFPRLCSAPASAAGSCSTPPPSAGPRPRPRCWGGCAGRAAPPASPARARVED